MAEKPNPPILSLANKEMEPALKAVRAPVVELPPPASPEQTAALL